MTTKKAPVYPLCQGCKHHLQHANLRRWILRWQKMARDTKNWTNTQFAWDVSRELDKALRGKKVPKWSA